MTNQTTIVVIGSLRVKGNGYFPLGVDLFKGKELSQNGFAFLLKMGDNLVVSLVNKTILFTLEKLSRQQMNDIFLVFPRKQGMKLHANCLLRRQFACNFKPYFLGKIRKKIFQNAVY